MWGEGGVAAECPRGHPRGCAHHTHQLWRSAQWQWIFSRTHRLPGVQGLRTRKGRKDVLKREPGKVLVETESLHSFKVKLS